MKDFVATNFSKYLKSTRKEQNRRKVAKSLYIFLTTSDEGRKIYETNASNNFVHHCNAEVFNIFDPELQLINTKPMIKRKLKELLSKLSNFKVQTILVLDYNKSNDRKIFLSSPKLIAKDLGIDEAFK